MEDRSPGDERMPISDEKKRSFREVPGSSRSVKGFGPFLVKAGDHLTLKIVEKLTTWANFEDDLEGVFDRIKREELPGLSFLKELVSRGQISKGNISYLSRALGFIGYQGIRTKIEELYDQHCCADVIKNGEKANSVSIQDGERAAKMMKPNNTDEPNTCDVFIVQARKTPQPELHSMGDGYTQATFLGHGLKGDQRSPVLLYDIGVGYTRPEIETFKSYIIRSYYEVPSKRQLFITPCTKVIETTPRHGLEVFSNPDPKTVVPQNAIWKVTPIGRVLNMASGKIVPSVKGVLVKIRFQWVDFRSSGTILTLRDASHPSLTAIVDENIDSIKSTLPQLCEGDIIEVEYFRTKRSQHEFTTCYVLSESRSTVRKVTDEHLQYVANQLPVLGCYQMRGIFTYIQTVPYEECAEVYCRGKRLRNSDMDPFKMMSCPRCERLYHPPVEKLGWFIRLVIDDGSDLSSGDSICNPIIFKNTVKDILQKMEDKQGHKEVQNESFKDIFHDKPVRAIVRPGSPHDVVMDLMLVKRLQRPIKCDTDVTSRKTFGDKMMTN